MNGPITLIGFAIDPIGRFLLDISYPPLLSSRLNAEPCGTYLNIQDDIAADGLQRLVTHDQIEEAVTRLAADGFQRLVTHFEEMGGSDVALIYPSVRLDKSNSMSGTNFAAFSMKSS